MRLAINFPDETAFYPGMGIEIYESSSSVQKAFKRLSKYAGFDLKKIVYSQGDELSENQKRIAVVVTSVLVFKEWQRWQKSAAINADYMCGKGIGYISALVCSKKVPLWYAICQLRSGNTGKPFFVGDSENVVDSEQADMSKIKSCDVLIEFAPSVISNDVKEQKVESGSQRVIYFDNSDDTSYLFDQIREQKVFNYFYAAKRFTGIAAATKNYMTNSDDYGQLDAVYMDLAGRVDAATIKFYKDHISLTETEFNECVDLLTEILRLKKVERQETAKLFIQLQNETGIDMVSRFEEWT